MRAEWQSREAGALLARLPAAVRGAVWGLTDDPADRWHAVKTLAALPNRLQRPVLSTYRRLRERRGAEAANIALCDVREAFTHERLSLAASDWEICEAAEQRAKRVSELLADMARISSADHVRDKLKRYAEAHGIGAPKCETLSGMVARMTDAQWWRRALRRYIAREVERHAIRFGMVHKRASIYASSEAVARRGEQKRRNARMLDGTTAENELGQTFTLAELSARNVSNPVVRRAELMTRIAGFEEFAREAGHVGMFLTITCPSRMHARLHQSGDENPKYDGTTPREAQSYLAAVWGHVRAYLARRGIYIYGFRICEPHHDGTPHWHLLIFMRPQVRDLVMAVMRLYFEREDSHELTAAEDGTTPRFRAVEIDWERGSAAGYVAKYIAKNVDGYRVGGDYETGDERQQARADAADTVRAVDAWAATWGIRQFQQVGGPGVTIWRELRRLREQPQCELFDAIWLHADGGNWHGYVRAMGGVEVKRADRPAMLWKVYQDTLTRYWEPAGEVTRGVWHVGQPINEGLLTRMHEWRIRGRGEGGRGQPAALPRTRVNNCYGAVDDERMRDDGGGTESTLHGPEKVGGGGE